MPNKDPLVINKVSSHWNTYYDVNEYIHKEIEYFTNNKQEYLVSILMDEERDPSEVTDAEIEHHFLYDQYLPQYHFEYFQEDIQEEFGKYEGKARVEVYGYNMGWRNRTGHKIYDLNNAFDIYREIAPDCDLIFKIKKVSPEHYEATIYHHDSPTGERYDIVILPF